MRLLGKLRDLRRKGPARDQLLLRIGAAKKEAGWAFGFVRLQLPPEGATVTRQMFTFALDKEKLKKSELRDGPYLLRSNRGGEDPAVLWERYIQLTQIEAAFKTLKSELGRRPLYHQLEKRGEAHIFVAFLAYALSVTLQQRLTALAPGLTPRAGLEKLATIQMLDVCPDAGRLSAHHRWALADHAALHPAGTRSDADAAPTQAVLTCPTAAPPQGPGAGRTNRAAKTGKVVPTFMTASLKINPWHSEPR